MSNAFTFISTFTGIGGFDIGFENSGMTCIGQCEIDRFANMVLRKQWPNAKRVDDVRKISRATFPVPDLICGGFPCQDLSVAGKRKGLAGDRSGLFFEFERIVSEFRPTWFVIENVPGLLSSNEKKDFATVLRRLGECGYLQAYRVFDSQYFGVAQRRRRVFIVGSLGNGRCAQVLFESESMPWDPAEGRKAGKGIAADITPCLTSSGRGTKGAGESRGQDPVVAVETGAGFWSKGLPRLRVSSAPSQPQTIVAETYRMREFGDYVASSSSSLKRRDHKDSHDLAVVHTLRAEGCNGSEDGTGRGTPLVPICFHARQDPCVSDKAFALDVSLPPANAIAFNLRGRDGGAMPEIADKVSLRSSCGGSSKSYVCYFGVRRLTPRECERLQGFPDDWTRYGVNENGNQTEISDTQRYKMCGNAVTVSVAEWIGRRTMIVR